MCSRSCANPHTFTQIWISAWLGLFLLLWPGQPAAQSDPFESLSDETVQYLINTLSIARNAEGDGRWLDAAEYYQEMYEQAPIEEYRYRQAYCLEMAGQYMAALNIFRELERSSRQDISSNAIARVHSLAQTVANLPARLRVLTSELGAVVTIDNQQSGLVTETGLEVDLRAGEHLIVVHLSGYEPVEQSIALGPGEDRRLVIDLVPLGEAGEADQPGEISYTGETPQSGGVGGETELELSHIAEEGGNPYVLPIVLGSSAVLVAGAGLVFGLISNDRAEEERNYDRQLPGASRDDLEQLADEAHGYALAANISFGVAGALAIGGVVLFLLADGSEDPGTLASVPEHVSRTGPAMVFTWSWK